VGDTKIDSFRVEFRTEIKSLHTENNAMRREMDKIWKLLVMVVSITVTTFIAIITVIGLLLRVLNII